MTTTSFLAPTLRAVARARNRVAARVDRGLSPARQRLCSQPRSRLPGGIEGTEGDRMYNALRSFDLFNGMTDAQLAELVEAGAEVRVEPGVELFHEGEHADFWWVLVDGAIELVRHIGREDVAVGRMDVPGR